MVDGIQKGQQFLKMVEGNVTGREYWRGTEWRKQMNFTVCGQARQGGGEDVCWKLPGEAGWSGE